MIDVFFSEGAKYSIKRAKEIKNNKTLQMVEDVLYIGSNLDIGRLSADPSDYKRQKLLNEVLDNGFLNPSELRQVSKEQRGQIEKLLAAANKGKVIRIWKSEAAFSATAFSFVCHLLKDIHCEIRVISLVKNYVDARNRLISFQYWGELAPEDYHSFPLIEEKLTEVEKKSQSALWKELKKENSPLRAVVNGTLISVPEDFYDHLLIKNFPDEEFKVEELLTEVIGKYPLAVTDGWYLYRLDQMIERNQLKVTSPKNVDSPFQKILKKTND